MPLLLGAWTLSSESSDGAPIDHKPWNPKGKAVVKTPNGVSHVIRKSRCYPSVLGAPRTGRLQFGGTPIDSDLPYMSIVTKKRKGSPAVLDIIDGVLRLAPNATIAVLGKAQVQDGFARRGTFVLYQNKGGGVTGKARYTGSWNCANMPWNPRGKAVVKTPDGVSHVIRSSFCQFGPNGLVRLRFGGKPSATTDMPYMQLVARRREGNPAVLDIIDGVLEFPPEWGDANHFGTVHVQVARRRGTFALFDEPDDAGTGKPRYTGSWVCG
jgi:hypothetical protein